MHLKIVRVNQCFWVERWQSWMAEPLTGHRVEMRRKQSAGKYSRAMEPVKVSCPCYTVDPQTSETLFYAGMLDKFLSKAKKEGYEVAVVDGRDPNPMKLQPRREAIPKNLRYGQGDALEAIFSNDKGIVQANTGFGKSFLMSNLCRIYPTAHIVIVTAARELVKQIYDGIAALLGTAEVGLVRGGTPSTEEEKRVVVTTCASVLRAPLKTCDFLFFDEVHNIGFNQTFYNLIENLGPARCFGFSASPVRGDEALDAIKSLFGKVIASCTYEEAVEHKMVTPIRAFMPVLNISEKIPVSEDKVAAERWNYWRNKDRNDWLIRQACEAVEAFPDEQMLITVKTLEHAVILLNDPRLSDWELIYSGSLPPAEKVTKAHTMETAPDSVHAKDTRNDEIREYSLCCNNGVWGYMSGNVFVDFVDAMRYLRVVGTGQPVAYTQVLPQKLAGIDISKYHRTKKEVSEQVAAFGRGELKHVIATSMIKEGGNFPHLSHIFRADGSASQILNTQFPGRASRLFATKPEAVIIDPFDNWNDWVRGRSFARMKTYKKQGWLT